jgi:hypothetical protein
VPWFRDALTWPRVTDGPEPSAHLETPHLAEIQVNPEALETYRTLVVDTKFPPGTVLVERLRDARTGRLGAILALERGPTADDWRYWALDSQGQLEPDVSLELCAACHAGALAAPVFGPRRSVRTTQTPTR